MTFPFDGRTQLRTSLLAGNARVESRVEPCRKRARRSNGRLPHFSAQFLVPFPLRSCAAIYPRPLFERSSALVSLPVQEQVGLGDPLVRRNHHKHNGPRDTRRCHGER